MSYYSGRGDCMYGRGDYYRGDYYRGDPFSLGSVFSGIAKVAGGFLTGGPIGAISAGVGLVTGGARPPLGSTQGVSVATNGIASPMILPPAPSSVQGTAIAPSRPIIGFGGNVGPIQGGFAIGGVPPSYPTNPQVGTVPSVSLTPSGALVPCQLKGYHPNKSTYYRAGTRIPKGSVCVKSRRMNVANPRALRRAIRRAHGFAKLARRVLSYPIHKPPKGRALFKKRHR